MVHCVYCGKEIVESANYCPYCGKTNRLVYSHPYYPPYRKERSPLVIIVAVVIAVFMLQVLLSAGLYIMVMGFGPSNGTPSTPMVTFTSDSMSGDKVTFHVVAVSSPISLAEVWINMQAGQVEGGRTGSAGFPEGSNISGGGFENYWLSFNDHDGDRMLTVGDSVSVSYEVGPLPSGPITVSLREGQYGPTMGLMTYNAP